MNREIKGLTLNFHYMYEKLAPEFGYETREDTKKFDFNSPNGKLMYKTVKSVMEPILKENQELKKEKQELIYYLKEGICFLKEKIFEKSLTENSFTLALLKNKLTTYEEILSKIEKSDK